MELKENNVGILCIEHNLDAIRPIADRVLTISNGEISAWQEPEYEIHSQLSHQVISSKELLSLENVSFSYSKIPVLQDVSLSIHEGEVIALMGENGSGKTTLLSVLGGLLKPTGGHVYLDRTSISSIDSKDIARRISIVFQNPNHQIFERTVWKEQILTSKILDEVSEDVLQRSKNLLQNANLGNYLDRNPFSLSHGQKRRLNMTSVLVHNPDILLLDEPFIGQDQDGRDFILNKIAITRAALIVTHNPNFVRNYCNRVIFVKNGGILLDGSPETVFQHLKEIGLTEYSGMEVNN
jgi:energy-coupling factor transport system ATP-binding protein